MPSQNIRTQATDFPVVQVLLNEYIFAANVEKAHADMLKLGRVFFIPENVKLSAAVSLIKKPRYSKIK